MAFKELWEKEQKKQRYREKNKDQTGLTSSHHMALEAGIRRLKVVLANRRKQREEERQRLVELQAKMERKRKEREEDENEENEENEDEDGKPRTIMSIVKSEMGSRKGGGGLSGIFGSSSQTKQEASQRESFIGRMTKRFRKIN